MTGREDLLPRLFRAAGTRATTAGYLSGWRLVRMLPEPVSGAAFAGIAEQVFRRDGAGVRRLRGNLARARPGLDPPELDALTRSAVHSYLRYWCESFRLPAWPTPDLVRRTRVLGEQALRDAYGAGKGVVVALPHMGNWDWAGAWACATGMPVTTVAERLRPERLYAEFVAYRNRLGMEILPLTGDSSVFRRLADEVSAGGLVCLLADRDLSRSSLEVTLCGEVARMPRGPAALARRTGAPLIPATLRYARRELEVTLHPVVPPAAGEDGLAQMTQAIADAFTAGIRASPQDWHMMQRVFVADLEAPRS